MKKLTPLFALVFACSQSSSQQSFEDEAVPAGEVLKVQGKGIAGRFWAELSPADGSVTVYKLSVKNTINRKESAPLTYDYSGTATLGTCTPGSTCVPSSDTVRLYTDQSKVTGMLSDGSTCRSNFGPCDGMSGRAPYPSDTACQGASTWCGPLQMVSNYADALPDPIVQIANATGQPNSILGCKDTPAGAYGVCAILQPDKVDSAYSNLTSPSMSLPSGTFGCSLCYGNEIAANNASLPGLANVVVPNLSGSTADTALKAINTDTLSLQLANDQSFGVVITVYYALPALDATGNLTLEDAVMGGTPTCAVSDDSSTIVHVFGGGFGPAGECLDSQPLTTCEVASLTLGAGYTLSFHPTSGSDVVADIVQWSDVEVDAFIPSGMTGNGWTGVITTPLGVVVTSDSFDICP